MNERVHIGRPSLNRTSEEKRKLAKERHEKHIANFSLEELNAYKLQRLEIQRRHREKKTGQKITPRVYYTPEEYRNRVNAKARAALEAMSDEEYAEWRKLRTEQASALRGTNPKASRDRVKASRLKRRELLGDAVFLAEQAERMREWKSCDPAEVAAYCREYRLRTRAKHLVKQAKARAKKKGLGHDISNEDIEPMPTHCPALGIELDYFRQRAGFNSPTLDRIHNNKGYVKGNVIVVSRKANTMKSDGNSDDLSKLAKFYEARERSDG